MVVLLHFPLDAILHMHFNLCICGLIFGSMFFLIYVFIFSNFIFFEIHLSLKFFSANETKSKLQPVAMSFVSTFSDFSNTEWDTASNSSVLELMHTQNENFQHVAV